MIDWLAFDRICLKPMMELIFDRLEMIPNTYEGELAFDVKREAPEHFIAGLPFSKTFEWVWR